MFSTPARVTWGDSRFLTPSFYPLRLLSPLGHPVITKNHAIGAFLLTRVFLTFSATTVKQAIILLFPSPKPRRSVECG